MASLVSEIMADKGLTDTQIHTHTQTLASSILIFFKVRKTLKMKRRRKKKKTIAKTIITI